MPVKPPDPSGKGKVRVITSYAIHAISSSSMQARERYLPLQIDIIDNGPGIPEAIRDILFEPFISNKAEGSGLGLAVVASAIAEHGGVVRQNPMRTHFQILLPISPVVQIIIRRMLMSFSTQAPSIIVADDDKSVRIVIGQALKKQGYLVHTTATAGMGYG